MSLKIFATHPPYLPCNGGDIHFFGREVMDLLVACDPLLVELKAFCFQMFPHAGLQGEPVALPPPRRDPRLASAPGL
jgi:hypothetical protein